MFEAVALIDSNRTESTPIEDKSICVKMEREKYQTTRTTMMMTTTKTKTRMAVLAKSFVQAIV